MPTAPKRSPVPVHAASAWQGLAQCQQCSIRQIALFASLTEQDFGLIHAPIDDLSYRSGQTLFQQGQQATGVFTIRSGVLKLSRVSADGRQRVLRVHKPGDLIGLEALTTRRYDSDAVCVTDASLCRIPTDVIHRLSDQSSRLREGLLRKWHDTLREADDWLAAVNFGPARQRLAHLVLKMRHRDEPDRVTLFSREDMGAMMDLKHETVSRELSALVRAGVLMPLDRSARAYRIQDEARLRRMTEA